MGGRVRGGAAGVAESESLNGSAGFLGGGTCLCRKSLFFKVSLVTLKTVTRPHTHCLRMLFSESLLTRSCRDFWQALQTCPDTVCILARSPALGWAASLRFPLHAALILKVGGNKVASKGMQGVYLCSRKYVSNAGPSAGSGVTWGFWRNVKLFLICSFRIRPTSRTLC